MNMSAYERTYIVAGMTCDHCKTAVTDEVESVAGVDRVDVDLETKQVVVRGEDVTDEDVRAAIREAGYNAA
jgi:copper chaperone